VSLLFGFKGPFSEHKVVTLGLERSPLWSKSEIKLEQMVVFRCQKRRFCEAEFEIKIILLFNISVLMEAANLVLDTTSCLVLCVFLCP